MLDGNAILQQARNGGAPPNWTVIPARRSHFLQTIAGGIIGVIAFGAAIAYLLFNPDFVVGLRGFVNLSGTSQFWRILDFAICGLAIIASIAYAVSGARDMDSLGEQVLVLMPEGFVMQRGSTSNTLSTIAYAAVRQPRVTITQGTVYLVMARTQDGSVIRLKLDNRFGPAKKIAQRIVDAQGAYVAATARP